MNQRIGTYVLQKTTGGEPFKAYLPPQLPPQPPLSNSTLISN
jgi:hypothetical protein